MWRPLLTSSGTEHLWRQTPINIKQRERNGQPRGGVGSFFVACFQFFISALRISQQLYWWYSPSLEVLPDLPSSTSPWGWAVLKPLIGCLAIWHVDPVMKFEGWPIEISECLEIGYWPGWVYLFISAGATKVRKFLLCVTGRQTSVWKGKSTRYLSPGPSSHLGNIWSSGSGRSLIEMQKPKVKAV